MLGFLYFVLCILYVRFKIILYYELFLEFFELMLVSFRVLVYYFCLVFIDKSSNKFNYFIFFVD